MLLGWDRQGTDTGTPTPTFIEITLTPTGDGTNVKVQFSGLSAEDAAFYPQLGRVTLTGSQLPWLRRTRARQLSQESPPLKSVIGGRD